MDNNFLKPFLTLFGIGAAISLAKSMRSKKPVREVISEMIISGFLATGAALVMLFYPTTNFLIIAGAASLLTILGVAFFSDKIERYIDKFLPAKTPVKEEDSGPKL